MASTAAASFTWKLSPQHMFRDKNKATRIVSNFAVELSGENINVLVQLELATPGVGRGHRAIANSSDGQLKFSARIGGCTENKHLSMTARVAHERMLHAYISQVDALVRVGNTVSFKNIAHRLAPGCGDSWKAHLPESLPMVVQLRHASPTQWLGDEEDTWEPPPDVTVLARYSF